MRVSGFWSAIGLVVVGLIVADLVLHPSGTAAAGSVLTTLGRNTGNQLIGTKA
jgi:hypothetical protein